MSEVHIYCPSGFEYKEANVCRVFLLLRMRSKLGPPQDISHGVVTKWNQHWDKIDDSNLVDDVDYHNWCKLRLIDNGEILVNASESFGIEDFAAILEDVFPKDTVFKCFDAVNYPRTLVSKE